MYETPIYWIFLMLESRKLWSRPILWSYFKFMWSWPSHVFFCTIYLWHIKIYIFLVRKLKKGNIFEIWPLSLSIWSSNSGHEPEKGGHMNPMVLYWIIDLWHIKTYICLVRKLKKGNIIDIWPLFTLHVVIK